MSRKLGDAKTLRLPNSPRDATYTLRLTTSANSAGVHIISIHCDWFRTFENTSSKGERVSIGTKALKKVF
jgi:hypothetical protein